MTARPPSSTLFPYTTLFRSHVQRTPAQEWLAAADTTRKRCAATRFDAPPAQETLRHSFATVHPAHSASAEDRKSTRLNSSHRCISYAVFCLKKKTHDLRA